MLLDLQWVTSRKTPHKSKMHLIHLTQQISEFTQPALKVCRTQDPENTRTNTACCGVCVHPRDHRATGRSPASHERLYCTSLARKRSQLKFRVRFLLHTNCLCTILKCKNHKSETGCTLKIGHFHLISLVSDKSALSLYLYSLYRKCNYLSGCSPGFPCLWFPAVYVVSGHRCLWICLFEFGDSLHLFICKIWGVLVLLSTLSVLHSLSSPGSLKT